MRKYCLLAFAFVLASFSAALAQTDYKALHEVKDSIVARYNRNDFKGIYRLADTAFSNHITEQQLSGFLRNNRNSGNIITAMLQVGADGKYSYILSCETRDIRMGLAVSAAKKFTSFGFSNLPVVMLTEPKVVKNDNPLKTTLDKAVDSLALKYFKNPNAAGISIGIIKNGVAYTYHYGESDKKTKQLPSANTMYEIGSVTKTFTATVLAQAVIDGKVRLDDDIRKFLSGDYPNLSYAGKPITLKDLANHTSRIPPLPDDIENQKNFNPVIPERNYDEGMYYAALHRLKLDTLPGTKYNYSNWGVSVLGHIMERVYGQPLDVLVKKYITKPFGMKNTVYRLNKDQTKAMALPYTDNGKLGPFQEEGIFSPAGGIHASLGDMLFYVQQQISEINQAVKLTHQRTVGNVGLGWGVRNNGSYRDLQHNGSTLGFLTHVSVFPELGNGLVIMANSKADMNFMIIGLQNILKN
ncbi:MAG: serine hydrolase domain-containing protein [Bacteroidota bacterium]